MFYNYRRKLLYWQFNRAIAGIADTPPLRVVDAPWTMVSMVSRHHIPMYLLTMKAFYRRVGAGRVVAIVARDTPRQSLELLHEHIHGIELRILEDLDTGTCQRGGTWERLVHILDLARDRYVVQIDADVLAVGQDLSEIVNCIHAGRAFALADGYAIQSMREAAEVARRIKGDYIGEVSERQFDRYTGHESRRYLRGSSGLAGFSKGGFARADLEDFHREMERLIGPRRWREWGTEQCASNFAVANSPGAIALPYPTYANYGGARVDPRTKCLHFIGTWRFTNGLFARYGRREIAALKRNEPLRSPWLPAAPLR